MSEKHEEQVDRRHFLRAAAVTAVAATATGAGAVFIRSTQSQPTAPVAAPPVLPVAQTVVTGNGQAADLLAQLAAVQAENVRLQAGLAAAERRIESQNTPKEEPALQAMSLELESANKQVGLLAGLVAMYEQLDDLDMGDWIEDGVTAVSTAISGLTDDLPDLNDGITMGQKVLAELDDHIPLLENGRSWLTHQTEKLLVYFEAIETLLTTAVKRVGPFLQMFSEWVQDILNWLPFGLGQQTSSVMDALTNLLLETPHTVNGLYTNIAEPLDLWLGGDNDDVPLRQNVIKPLREQVLAKAGQVAEKTAHVETTYQENVARPVGTAVANRRQVRGLITTYRQQHQL